MTNVTGGALTLYNTISNINGSLSLKRNEADRGGGMEVIMGNLSIQGCALFDGNTAEYGGALHLTGSHVVVPVLETTWLRSYYQGGDANSSNASFDDKCFINNVVTVTSLSFLRNVGSGGSILCWSGCSLKFIGTVYFNESFQSAVVFIPVI